MTPRAQASFNADPASILAAIRHFRLHPEETKCCAEDEPLVLEIVSIEELPPHIQLMLP